MRCHKRMAKSARHRMGIRVCGNEARYRGGWRERERTAVELGQERMKRGASVERCVDLGERVRRAWGVHPTFASCGLHGFASLSSPSLKKSEWPEAI